MKKYIIYGTGGFAREVACILKSRGEFEDLECFVDIDEVVDSFKGATLMGRYVMDQSVIDPSNHKVLIGIGNSKIREKIVRNLPSTIEYPILIDPNAEVSDWATLGEGTIVCAGTIITCQIDIGKHCQLNLHTTIGHDCIIDDYFTSAPGAKISGDCNFRKHVYFGTSSAVRQGVSIVENVTIGMGAMVVKDIVESGVYVGIPAKKLNI